jgi:excisionase family DNA binding protein
VKLLTPEVVAEQLAVSRSTVLRMIADGALPAVCLRSGRRKKVWRVREEMLQKWIIAKERQRVTWREAAPAVSDADRDQINPRNGRELA